MLVAEHGSGLVSPSTPRVVAGRGWRGAEQLAFWIWARVWLLLSPLHLSAGGWVIRRFEGLQGGLAGSLGGLVWGRGQTGAGGSRRGRPGLLGRSQH